MFDKIIRSENLLWIVPTLYGIIACITSYNDVAMIFFDNSYLLLSFPAVVGVLLVTLVIPYFIHLLLREIGDRKFVLAWAHIAISVVLSIAILFIYSYSLPINIKWRFHVGELPAYKKWLYYNLVAINIIKIFIATQSIFTAYGLGLFIRSYFMNTKAQGNIDQSLDLQEQELGRTVASMIA